MSEVSVGWKLGVNPNNAPNSRDSCVVPGGHPYAMPEAYKANRLEFNRGLQPDRAWLLVSGAGASYTFGIQGNSAADRIIENVNSVRLEVSENGGSVSKHVLAGWLCVRISHCMPGVAQPYHTVHPTAAQKSNDPDLTDGTVSNVDGSNHIYLLEMADIRHKWLKLQHIHKAYNVRLSMADPASPMDPSTFRADTLNMGALWTYAEILEDLWGTLSEHNIGDNAHSAFPTFTNTDTPENIVLDGANAWTTIYALLSRLGYAVVRDPITDLFSFEPFSTPQADLSTIEDSMDPWTFNGVPYSDISLDIPDHIEVAFDKAGPLKRGELPATELVGYDASAPQTFDYSNAQDEPNRPVSINTNPDVKVVLQGDISYIPNSSANDTARAARALALAQAYIDRQVMRRHRIATGFSPTIKTGTRINKVIVRGTAEGTFTEILDYPDASTPGMTTEQYLADITVPSETGTDIVRFELTEDMLQSDGHVIGQLLDWSGDPDTGSYAKDGTDVSLYDPYGIFGRLQSGARGFAVSHPERNFGPTAEGELAAYEILWVEGVPHSLMMEIIGGGPVTFTAAPAPSGNTARAGWPFSASVLNDAGGTPISSGNPVNVIDRSPNNTFSGLGAGDYVTVDYYAVDNEYWISSFISTHALVYETTLTADLTGATGTISPTGGKLQGVFRRSTSPTSASNPYGLRALSGDAVYVVEAENGAGGSVYTIVQVEHKQQKLYESVSIAGQILTFGWRNVHTQPTSTTGTDDITLPGGSGGGDPVDGLWYVNAGDVASPPTSGATVLVTTTGGDLVNFLGDQPTASNAGQCIDVSIAGRNITISHGDKTHEIAQVDWDADPEAVLYESQDAADQVAETGSLEMIMDIIRDDCGHPTLLGTKTLCHLMNCALQTQGGTQLRDITDSGYYGLVFHKEDNLVNKDAKCYIVPIDNCPTP